VGNITAGYRCLECEVDYCDACTSKEGRDALRQWPMQELKRLLNFIQISSGVSQTATEFINSVDKNSYLKSMSTLCTQLQYCKSIKEKIEVEAGVNKLKQQRMQYLRATNDA
jgi:hypothetical protein